MKSMWVIASLAALALPAGASEYYVVRDVSTKQCKIVETPPTTTDLVVVENGSVYFERNEAERVLPSLAECNPHGPKTASSAVSTGAAEAEVRRTKKPKDRIAAKKPPAPTTASQPAGQRDPISFLFALFR